MTKDVFDVTGCSGCQYKEHYVEQGMCGDFCHYPYAPKPLKVVDDGKLQECPLVDGDLVPVVHCRVCANAQHCYRDRCLIENLFSNGNWWSGCVTRWLLQLW